MGEIVGVILISPFIAIALIVVYFILKWFTKTVDGDWGTNFSSNFKERKEPPAFKSQTLTTEEEYILMRARELKAKNVNWEFIGFKE